MAAQSKSSKRVLRGILRLSRTPPLSKELAKKEPVQNTHLNPTRAFILKRYRSAQNITDKEEIAKLKAVAYDYLQLQKDLTERARLYDLDRGAEVVFTPKEMSRRAAARSGLQLPKLDPDLE
ncbi:predicted protein [Phaeodactylum tricornutum CCAP 1055/1]|jgi:hypothetical protein|uniref:Uncharacterized protein n=1 Tax=Phaeodactylum tricornutum (strain CCAP 1055/1) TaxID=556484 RepID=B5Y3X4_PHATC|nr:predicted protein [Phaeodactylum tricornutum CCAP 1055/1]ACI65206.1 predicted protein [Phaeodactylum tricornutum CCAP 1055/1]|eukprot:XP_002185736.1 predicted protein [Phaeodactylum tricornutum CCAP 1055/1]